MKTFRTLYQPRSQPHTLLRQLGAMSKQIIESNLLQFKPYESKNTQPIITPSGGNRGHARDVLLKSQGKTQRSADSLT